MIIIVITGENKLVKPPFPLFGIEGRYTTALYSAGYKQKKLDLIEADLKKITELCEKDRPFRELLVNPLVKVSGHSFIAVTIWIVISDH